MNPIEVSAYLSRLGLPELAGSPQRTAATLSTLHAAHVERIPFETLSRPDGVDPADSVRRIVTNGRGGVCYHLNGAFGMLLRALGFTVSLHAAGVQSRFAPVPQGPNGTHNVLIARGLPSPENPQGRWLLDVGSGEGFHRPLPLRAGVYEQGGFRYELRPSTVPPTGSAAHWRLDYDHHESCRGLDFTEEPWLPERFATPYREQSVTHMAIFFEYGWVKRHHAAGYDELIGCQLSHVTVDGRRTRTLRDEQAWFDALRTVFGVELTELTAAERTALWERVERTWTTRDFRTAITPRHVAKPSLVGASSTGSQR